MNWLTGILRILSPRIIGAAVSAAAGFVYAHSKGAVTLDTTTTVELVSGMLATYAATHKAVSSVVNPGDAAKGRVVDAVNNASATGSTVRVAPPT